jgi:polysaccharide export outer membrane protein
LKITRRIDEGTLPLPDATKDPSGKFITAEVSLKSLMEARRPEENINVKPNDVITVPAAGNLYVIGHVLKAGPLLFDQRGRMTALQAVSAAGGMDNLAKPTEVRILRVVPGQDARTEIALNLDNVMRGKAPDMALEVEDVVLVPNNKPKAIMLKTLDVAIQVGTGVVIWRRY